MYRHHIVRMENSLDWLYDIGLWFDEALCPKCLRHVYVRPTRSVSLLLLVAGRVALHGCWALASKRHRAEAARSDRTFCIAQLA